MTSCFKVPPSCLPYHGESCSHTVSQNKPFLPQAALARYFVIATKTPEGPGRKQTYSESLYGAFRKATLIEDQSILQGTSGELSLAEGTSLSVTEHSKFRPSVQTHERPGWVAYHQSLGSSLTKYRYYCTNQSHVFKMPGTREVADCLGK